VGSGTWSVLSGGTGSFTPNTTTPNATFTHATGAGPVVLRWRITSGTCTPSDATVSVTITPPPSTATVGGPQTICALGTTGNLQGNNPGTGNGLWTVQSGGTGTFSNANAHNSTFTHTGGVGPVVVRWTISNGSCTPSFAEVTITINQPPTTATVGGPQTICALGTTTGLGGNAPSVGAGVWSVLSGGTGSFTPNNATPNATFTHLTGLGPVVLRWRISNNPCTPSDATVTITINQNPTTATAGGPQTICPLDTTTSLGGNSPSVGTGVWSVVGGGTGTFSPNTSDPNATFTHTGGAGPVQLRWTISNPPCVDSFFDVFVTIDDADGDGVCNDGTDNCPGTANAGQEDADGDSIGDACDACPNDATNDADADGVCEDVDNCPGVFNPGQTDSDGDGLGNNCDACPFDRHQRSGW
jgi:hypothetical protein